LTERETGDPNATEAAGRARDGIDPSPFVNYSSCGASAHSTGCEVWGVLNVTPDSFSDGGAFMAADAAFTQALRLMREGAHVIDVGGESSRPSGKTYGDVPQVSEQEELSRVMPVIGSLCAYGARVSIDTTKAGVAERAVRAGASIINDVSCGRGEGLLRVAAETGVELVLMHNRGRGERTEANTRYGASVARTVRDELMAAMDRAVTAGVQPAQIWLDPGIGFAKQAQQSAALLAQTDLLVASGQRVLVGVSRKSFIAELVGGSPRPTQRLGGSLAALTLAVLQGARAVRVHDVFESRQAVDMALQLRSAHPRMGEGRP